MPTDLDREPPIGCMPQKIWREKRIEDLARGAYAITSSLTGIDYSLVREWAREIIEHIRWIEGDGIEIHSNFSFHSGGPIRHDDY